MPRYVLSYVQPRLAHPNKDSVIPERKTHRFEADDDGAAIRKKDKFLQVDPVVLNGKLHYRSEIALQVHSGLLAKPLTPKQEFLTDDTT